MISGKYKLRIVWDLKDGPLRYGEIRQRAAARRGRNARDRAARAEPRIEGARQSGLIDRKDYGVVPPKVEYRLTRKGRSFVPIIAAIRKWGTRHLQDGAGEKVEGLAGGIAAIRGAATRVSAARPR